MKKLHSIMYAICRRYKWHLGMVYTGHWAGLTPHEIAADWWS